jgi:DNA excision repair protein ERCC-2
VSAVIQCTSSGVGVFSPSYAMTRVFFELVSRRVPGRHMVSEVPGMSNQDASDVFDSFRSGRDSVLFGVQGGRFSEGEDFSGDTMGSVAVIGLSLPPPSPLMYAEYSFLKRAGEQDSYLMLSRLPALRKAFQAAGRHIRNPGKRGLVFFFDERFRSEAVRSLMPSWMRRDLLVGDFTPSAIRELTSGFWDRRSSPLLPA